jgi:hypothetical protein
MKTIDRQLRLFPRHLPDEAFVSFIYRYHLLSCNAAIKTTLFEMFDQDVHTTAIFPYGLVAFVGKFPESLGLSAMEICRRFTPLPYLLPFQFTWDDEEFEKKLLDGSPLKNNWRFFAKRHDAHISGAEPRFCTLCVAGDKWKYGLPYFHRSHQIPEVTYCPKHCIKLISACTDCGPRPWHPVQLGVPGGCQYCGKTAAETYSSKALTLNEQLQLALSKTVGGLLEENFRKFNPKELRDTYHDRLLHKGFILNGKVAIIDLAAAMTTYFGDDYLRSLGAALTVRSGTTSLWCSIFLISPKEALIKASILQGN